MRKQRLPELQVRHEISLTEYVLLIQEMFDLLHPEDRYNYTIQS